MRPIADVLGPRGWLLVPVAVVLGALGLMVFVGASEASSVHATGKLLVVREHPEDDSHDWFVVNADGSGLRSSGSGGSPIALSPDGKWIARNYVRNHLGMFVTRTNGSDKHAIKPFNGKGLWTASLAHLRAHLIVPIERPLGGRFNTLLGPAWSPTDSYIAFFAKKNFGSKQWLYIVRPDGTRLRPIGGSFVEPSRAVSWAPNERSLLVSGVHGQEFLYHVKVNTGARTRLGRGGFPAWAPQGQRILFTLETGTSTRPRTQLLVMRTDGSGRRVLAQTCSPACGNPAWSPDGTHIAFDNGAALVLMRTDGTEKRTLRRGRRVYMYIIDWSR